MTGFTLDCFSESGNAYKAALMLELCKADWEPRRIAFFAGESRSAEFREKNLMGEAPVLVHHLPDGDLTMTQSGAILDYLAEHFGRFGPENKKERVEILRWILWDNHKLSSYSATHRYLRHFMKKPADDPVVDFFIARAKGAWKVLETHLASNPFIVGGRPTIADFSTCGYLYWPSEIGMNQSDYPNITAWLGRIAALPGYKTAEDLMPSGQDPEIQTA